MTWLEWLLKDFGISITTLAPAPPKPITPSVSRSAHSPPQPSIKRLATPLAPAPPAPTPSTQQKPMSVAPPKRPLVPPPRRVLNKNPNTK